MKKQSPFNFLPKWFKRIFLLVLCTAFLLLIAYLLQDIKTGMGKDTTIRYEIVDNWLRLPDSVVLGNPTGIGIDSHQNLFVFHRASRKWPLVGSMPDNPIEAKTILHIDAATGRLINSWGDRLFIMPHGLSLDQYNNVWVSDVGLHQVFKFRYDGKLLLKLGEAGVAGDDSLHFNRPTDVAVAADGSFYVSDGYGNSRIIKFSPQGRYLFQWGKRGDRPGEFNVPHGVSLSSTGNVVVADRENNRIQIFDSTGGFIRQHAADNFANITSVTTVANQQKIFAADDLSFLKLKHRGSDVIVIDSNGLVPTRFGRSGLYKGPTCWYHDITVDSAGTIYTADILGNRLQKFMQVKR